MAGTKKAAPKKPAAARATGPAAKVAAVQKRAARDVSMGPSAKRIEQSLREGTKKTLALFRSSINWS